MIARLLTFTSALLMLPLSGLYVSGSDWGELAGASASYANTGGEPSSALAITLLVLTAYLLLVNLIVGLTSGHRPLLVQRGFFTWLGAASTLLGWLLVYLNQFSDSWITPHGLSLLSVLLVSLLFALLAPAVLLTRSLFGSFGGPLKRLSRIAPLPALASETSLAILLPLAIFGLIGGAVWPEQLYWLLWSAPLLLLCALQLLWGEGTIFSALKSGNWARLLFAALAGVATCNLALQTFQLSGGTLLIMTTALFAQVAYAIFGLLCLQLGDIIAENWRGTTRGTQFSKKKFPIPIITRKE